MKLKTIAQALLLAGLAGTALAQTSQRIEVTGSSIKRLADEAALPLQVITKDEIDNMGLSSVDQIVDMDVIGKHIVVGSQGRLAGLQTGNRQPIGGIDSRHAED